MSRENQYSTKWWARRWMFWALMYPVCLLENLSHCHHNAVESVKARISRFNFANDDRSS